jgi:two-component system sensor histidine kinase TctE
MVTVRVLEEAGHAVLEVEDNGPGLSADQRTAALQAQRGATRPLPSLAKGQTSGMGLGLAITAEISALFGADLDLTTGRGGTGLLARVRFPAAAGSVAPQPSA